MYFAVVAKEFITSSCGDGLPFQLGWLNQAGTARAIRWERKGQSGHRSQSSCKTSTIMLLREKMFCWCPASTGQGSEELGTYVVSRHSFWLCLKFFSLSLVLLIWAFGTSLSSQVQKPCLDLACDTNMVPAACSQTKETPRMDQTRLAVCFTRFLMQILREQGPQHELCPVPWGCFGVFLCTLQIITTFPYFMAILWK